MYQSCTEGSSTGTSPSPVQQLEETQPPSQSLKGKCMLPSKSTSRKRKVATSKEVAPKEKSDKPPTAQFAPKDVVQ
ncbi:hypothetical protein Dimus_028876 [Dionaea muscipula]